MISLPSFEHHIFNPIGTILIYNKIKRNLFYINNMLVDTFKFCVTSYQIKGLIC